MKIGISIPNNWGVADPARLIDMAVLAEQAGFASVWTSEHLINISYVRDRIGERPYYHPLSVLSAVAARTQRILLGTSVLVLPFHNPFDLAKYVATLDQISRGRLVLGVGVGNVPEEFEALGIPWEQRGALTDETIQILRKLWTEQAADHSGRNWTFSDVHTSPKPFADRRVPIWVGGMSPAARRRAVQMGEGWHPTALSASDLRIQIADLQALRAAEPHGGLPMEVCMRYNITLDDLQTTETEALSTLPSYDSRRVVKVVEEYEAAGVTHFVYALNGHDPSKLCDVIQRMRTDLAFYLDREPPLAPEPAPASNHP